MHFLAIETSTSVCSAALLSDSQCIRRLIDTNGQNHARQLPLFVDDLLKEAKSNNIIIDAVALSQGPGSYTGLRIGTALAKGLCYGYNIPLIAIDTLQLIALTATKNLQDAGKQPDGMICPMIDARRMEVYTALYDNNLQQIGETEAKIIDCESFSDILTDKKIYFCGDGSTKCKNVVKSANAVFIDNIFPQAGNMGRLALTAYKNNNFADLAYFDPFYLKEFQATVAKNKII